MEVIAISFDLYERRFKVCETKETVIVLEGKQVNHSPHRHKDKSSLGMGRVE